MPRGRTGTMHHPRITRVSICFASSPPTASTLGSHSHTARGVWQVDCRTHWFTCLGEMVALGEDSH